MAKTIRALERGIEVVTVLGRADEPLGLDALHRLTGLDKSTLLRVLATLDERGWVVRGLADRRYRLTRAVAALGARPSAEQLMIELAAPVLRELHEALGWPSDLCVQAGVAMRVIESSRSLGARVAHRDVRGFTPCLLRSAVGRAYLASCDDERRATLLARLRGMGGPVARLAGDRRHLEALRAEVAGLGHARRAPGERFMASEREVAYHAIAMPIRVGQAVPACLSVVYLPGGEGADEARLAAGLRGAVARLAASFAAHRLG